MGLIFGSIGAASAAPIALPTATPFETQFTAKWVNRYATSAHQSGDERKLSAFSSAFSGALRTASVFWVQGGIGFTQNIDPTPSFNLVNPDFRGFYLVTEPKQKKFRIELGPTASFALSEASQKESLYFSLGAAARFTFNLQETTTGGFLTYYDVAVNRNIHQYETSSLNTINTQYSIDHYFYFEYAFNSPWVIDAWVGFSSAWSYAGKISNAFTTGQEVSYSFYEWLDLTVAHERGGDYLSPSGQTYNFGLFDSNESRFSISTTLKF
jgi:hypothetical protein